jgi:hypothetical protein
MSKSMFESMSKSMSESISTPVPILRYRALRAYVAQYSDDPNLVARIIMQCETDDLPAELKTAESIKMLTDFANDLDIFRVMCYITSYHTWNNLDLPPEKTIEMLNDILQELDGATFTDRSYDTLHAIHDKYGIRDYRNMQSYVCTLFGTSY